MKRFCLCIGLGLFLTTALSAQVRTENDIDAGNFVLGSDACTICQEEGASLPFSTKGFVFEARYHSSAVDVADLQTGKVMTVLHPDRSQLLSLAYHDFTGDNNPELIIAAQSEDGLVVHIFEFDASTWKSIGELRADGVRECRIFRQVLTMKNEASGLLHSWTWRSNSFDYRSSK